MKETCHHVYGDCAKRGRTGLADRPQNKGPCGAGDVDSRGSSQPFKQTPPPTPSAFGSPVPPASLSGVTDQPAPAGPSPCAPTRPKEDRATWTLTNSSLGLRRLPRVKCRTGPSSRGSREGKGRAPA